MSIAEYAGLIRQHDRANGRAPSNLGDFELLCSYRYNSPPFSSASFPHAWNIETTNEFFTSLCLIIFKIALTAELTLEENQRYTDALNNFFQVTTDAALQTTKAQLPLQVREKLDRVENWLCVFNEDIKKDAEMKLNALSVRLTALIPDYIAQTHTVIGTPPDGLPVAYDSLESRYRHTFLIGRSGAGKSTVITNLVAQDMRKGYGVIVMSPDEDLMRRIVPYIPEHRLDDVIYFDPGDTTYSLIGFNPLYFETPAKLTARRFNTLRDKKPVKTTRCLCVP